MARRAKKNQHWPESGKLEKNVDAVLRANGLELNATLDKLIEKSHRRARHPLPKRRPARAKALRA